MSQAGYYYRLEGGRFLHCGDIGLGGSPGDSTVCVTGPGTPLDVHATQALLHAVGALPLPIAGRGTVSMAALQAAQASGTRAVFSLTTA